MTLSPQGRSHFIRIPQATTRQRLKRGRSHSIPSMAAPACLPLSPSLGHCFSSHRYQQSALFPLSFRRRKLILTSNLSWRPRLVPSLHRSLQRRCYGRGAARAAYVSAPASEHIAGEDNGTGLSGEVVSVVPIPVSWGVIWSLLSQHKLRIVVSLVSLVGCTSCTLAMPLFSGMT